MLLRKLTHWLIGLLITIIFSTTIFALSGYASENSNEMCTGSDEQGKKENIQGIDVLVLKGSYGDMGIQYGNQMKQKLEASLEILKNHYEIQHKIPYKKMIERADDFYNRFPVTYPMFIAGVAQGADISFV
jgi:hypothetical protein